MTGHRVVLTGLGALSSIGLGATEFAAGLRAGRSGARDITGFDTTGFEHSRGCEVRGFDPGDWIRNLPVESLGRATRFAVAAARMALEDAGLTPDLLRSRRGMVAIGHDRRRIERAGRTGRGRHRRRPGITGAAGGPARAAEPLVHGDRP